MKYKEYIDLGFKRVDMDDSVEFDQTGYRGFILTKQITDIISIEVSSGELDYPFMCITKRGSECSCSRVKITFEIVQDICQR